MNFTPQEMAILYGHWQSVPAIKIVDTNLYNKILMQNFRNSIVQILQKGIEDEERTGRGSTRRHVLSAKEIRNALETQLRMSVKYPGLYFHLGKLEEHGIISPVIQIKEKNNKVTFYCLTAKKYTDKSGFDVVAEEQDDHSKGELRYNLSQQLGVDVEFIFTALEELKRLQSDKPKGFEKWVEGIQLDAVPSEDTIRFLMEIYRLKLDNTQAINDLIDLLENRN